MTRMATFIVLSVLSFALVACSKGSAPVAPAAQGEAVPPPSNRIDIPPAVRQNLGITFAKVESRRVSVTRRYPGRFERLPHARREYHVAMPGRIELLVQQYDPVALGQPLARIDSPQWRELQQKLSSEATTIRLTLRRLDAVKQREKAVAEHQMRNDEIIAVWKAREAEVHKLIAAGGGGASELAATRAQLAEAMKEDAKVHEEVAELAESRILLESELMRYEQTMPLLYAFATGQPVTAEAIAKSFDVAFSHAASVTGYSVSELVRPGAENEAMPMWRTLDRLELRAMQAGVVEFTPVTNGTWAETGTLILSTVDPAAIRFRAIAPQSDLTFLRDGLSASILAPDVRTNVNSVALPATLSLGLEADAQQRTIEILGAPAPGATSRQGGAESLKPAGAAEAQENRAPIAPPYRDGAPADGAPSLPPWARAGVSAQIEVITDGQAEPELAIPVSAVIQDGLAHVLFRRDPKDANKVIRLEADMGVSDGQWIVIKSGLREGDEVVLQGVYELKLASSQSAQLKGGHFHADGTWHADGTPEP
ncbi:MAG: HlyD family efflux transporter periplasmic adaptor subunit [Phycisphaeraceae bacterium]